jgi:hypothetical protein
MGLKGWMPSVFRQMYSIPERKNMPIADKNLEIRLISPDPDAY